MIIVWFRTSKRQAKDANAEGISVIIAAHDEHQNLRTLVPLLLRQQYQDFEIVIALDRCTDDSVSYLATLSSLHSNLHFITIKETPPEYSGKKYALTMAIEKAKHDLLVFTDADCEPLSSKWLQSISNSFNKNIELAIGYSPYHKIPGLLNRFIRYETLLTANQYMALSEAGITYMGVGRNMAYRKSLFEKSAGFGEYQSVLGGDDDLFVGRNATRSNVSTYRSKETFMVSRAEDSWQRYFRQKTRHLSVGKYYKKRHQIILTMLGASQIMFWLTFAILAVLKTYLPLVVLCFAIRFVLQNAFFIKGTREIGDDFEYLWILILDLVHTIFLLVMGPVGFFTKKVKWN